MRLSFRLDDSGRVHVTGQCAADAVVACGRCVEDVPVRLRAAIDARLVRTEAEARALIADSDVIVAPKREVSVAALIEDDLLLSVPEAGCGDPEQCHNAPPMEYPPGAGEAAPVQAGPFAALAALKDDP